MKLLKLQSFLNIILIIFIVLAISGCNTKVNPNTLPPERIIHTGTEGLSINFFNNNPPEEIFQGNSFSVGLELLNKGAYNIEGADLRLGGYGPRYISLEKSTESIDLLGKSLEFPEGEKKIIFFDARSIEVPEGSKKHPESINARVYYTYETLANAQVCINPDIYGIAKEGCEVKAVTLSGGQGAPIAVTKVEESISMLSRESLLNVNFIIHVANKGSGEVIQDVIEVKEVILGTKRITCSPTLIKLEKNKESSFHCQTAVERPTGAFLSPLKVQLAYVYTQEVNKKFTVKSLT